MFQAACPLYVYFVVRLGGSRRAVPLSSLQKENEVRAATPGLARLVDRIT
jgi:hypothetical protein